MRNAILVTAVLLAGCGGASKTTVTTVDGNTVTVSTGGTIAGKDCSSKPDFAPLYPGGTITICNAAHFDATGKDAGSILYTTSATPQAVLAFAKQETAKSGLAPRLDLPNMFSAGEGNKRTMMVHVEAKPDGTHVVLNWGKGS